MSSLDDKLKDILSDLEKVSSGLIQVPWNQHDRALQQIKQAFKDAGYVQMAGKPVDGVLQTDDTYQSGQYTISVTGDKPYVGKLLTGAEWYNRFTKELAPYEYTHTHKVRIGGVLEAAKRASGLDTEG